MPFRKVAPNRNVSPSGKTFTDKQVRAYEATKGFTKPLRTPGDGAQRFGLSQERKNSVRHIKKGQP